MTQRILLRTLSVTVLFLMFVFAPCGAAGQRGGFGGGGFHGGGGGFHGGGGGFHGGGWSGGYHGGAWGGGYHGGGWSGYRGTGYYGGYHGAGNYPWHGGYGWRGGYWGYPGYGWGGWSVGIGFNFGWGDYWPAYPYYGYGPAWVPVCSVYYPCYPSYPYYYYAPVSDPPGTAVQYVQPTPNDPQPSAASQASAAHPKTLGNFSGVTVINASYRPPASTRVTSATYTEEELAQLRPAVQNVIHALRAMPPAARVQQIESGRYGNLSPQELRIVRYAAEVPPSE